MWAGDSNRLMFHCSAWRAHVVHCGPSLLEPNGPTHEPHPDLAGSLCMINIMYISMIVGHNMS